MRDTWISAQLKTRLVLDLAVLHINYDIETVNGVVQLLGIAQDEEELALVRAHSRDIPGVRRVANHVIVKDHPRRLPRIRDRRGRRTQARRGNAALGATPGCSSDYGHRYGGDAPCQTCPEGGKVGAHVGNIVIGRHAPGDGIARVDCRARHGAGVAEAGAEFRRMASWPRRPTPGSMHRPPRARTPRPPGLLARNPARPRCRPLSVFSATGVSLELPQSPR